MLYRELTNSVRVDTPAKLNLFLNVLGKRSDGYHELETLMVTVGLHDTLEFRDDPAGIISLRCFDSASRSEETSSRELPAGAENLVYRAADLLRRESGIARGAQINLHKRIPLASGLAGGSSDAAATLVGLNRLWKLGLTPGELHSFAARLGSDIPFFLCSTSAAVCRGRGEIIEPLALPLGLHFVVARPPSGLSTAEVFRHCRSSQTARSVSHLAECLARGRVERAAKLFHNSLQEPAERLNAEVTRLKRAFTRLPFVGHQMSGSGTSYFGLCRSRRQALQLAARLRAARLGDVFVAQCRP